MLQLDTYLVNLPNLQLDPVMICWRANSGGETLVLLVSQNELQARFLVCLESILKRQPTSLKPLVRPFDLDGVRLRDDVGFRAIWEWDPCFAAMLLRSGVAVVGFVFLGSGVGACGQRQDQKEGEKFHFKDTVRFVASCLQVFLQEGEDRLHAG